MGGRSGRRRFGRFGLGLFFGLVYFDSRFDQRTQLRQGNRFLQVVERTLFQCLHCLVGITESGNHGHGRVKHQLIDVLHHFQTRTVGHTHIRQYQRIVVVFQFFFGIVHADGGIHPQPHLHQGHFHQVADIRLVVYDQYRILQIVTLHDCCLSVKSIRIHSIRDGSATVPSWHEPVRVQHTVPARCRFFR